MNLRIVLQWAHFFMDQNPFWSMVHMGSNAGKKSTVALIAHLRFWFCHHIILSYRSVFYLPMSLFYRYPHTFIQIYPSRNKMYHQEHKYTFFKILYRFFFFTMKTQIFSASSKLIKLQKMKYKSIELSDVSQQTNAVFFGAKVK